MSSKIKLNFKSWSQKDFHCPADKLSPLCNQVVKYSKNEYPETVPSHKNRKNEDMQPMNHELKRTSTDIIPVSVVEAMQTQSFFSALVVL